MFQKNIPTSNCSIALSSVWSKTLLLKALPDFWSERFDWDSLALELKGC